MGELLMGRPLGKQAMAWGALFGIFPDVDVLLSLPFSSGLQIAFRQAATHSIWLLPFIAFGIGHGLERLWKRYKITRIQAAGFALTIMAGHVLLDCLTGEGASILWPFLGKRFSLGLLFRVDLLFSMALAFGVLRLIYLTLRKPPSSGKKAPTYDSQRRRACFWGVGLAAGYVCLGMCLKWVAATGFERDLKQRSAIYQKTMIGPARSNLFFWRAVVAREDEFWVGYRSVFESPGAKVRWTVYPQNKETLAGQKSAFEIRTLCRITDPWWVARTHAKGAWIGDLRLPEARAWGDKKDMVDSRLAHSWVFNENGDDQKLRLIDESWRNSPEMTRRMLARIFGNRAEWEANPRLAGVPGNLPEFLAAEE